MREPLRRAALKLTPVILIAVTFVTLVSGLGPWMVRADLTAPLLTEPTQLEPNQAPGSASAVGWETLSLNCPNPASLPRPDSVHRADADYWLRGWPGYARAASIGCLIVLLTCAFLTQTRRFALSTIHMLFLMLLGIASLQACNAALAGRWLEVSMGGLAMIPWLLGWVGSGIATRRNLSLLTLLCLGVLAFQGILAPHDMNSAKSPYGTQLLGYSLHRLVGTFELPGALGVFAAVCWAAAVQWVRPSARCLALITCLVVTVLIATGSATGWAAWLASLAVLMLHTARARQRLLALVIGIPLALALWAALPAMTGRSDVHDSLWGRIEPAGQFAETHLKPHHLMFGYRFGVGTLYFEPAAYARGVSLTPAQRPPTDSMPAVLLWQVGLFGLICAYALMLVALIRAPDCRLVGVALLVGSLSLSITEQPLLGLILAFWLARALRREPSVSPVNGKEQLLDSLSCNHRRTD